jgi:hypothetical protein
VPVVEGDRVGMSGEVVGRRSGWGERRSGWEASGGVFQLTRHWSGLPGGDRGEARFSLPLLNCAVSWHRKAWFHLDCNDVCNV